MTKFIFVSFPNEAKAYMGTRALQALHAEGSLTLYGMSVVEKGQDGKFSVKQESERGPLGIAVGSVVGGLVGLVGGPIGIALGVGGGALLGRLNDLSNLGVSRQFIDSVSTDLMPGNLALVAEVSEEWVTPLNERMKALGGIVHRTGRAAIEDELSQKEMAVAQVELAHLKTEYEHARAEGKAQLQLRIDEVEAMAQSTSERLHARTKDLKQETEAKLKSLQEQAAQVSSSMQAKIEERIAGMQADATRRSHQLNEAWDLAKKAFAS